MPILTTMAPEPSPLLMLANSPVLWACALGVFLVIIVQSVIYVRAARKAAPAAGMSPQDLRTSFRSGAVAAVGPSLAVVLVAIALLSLFGTPAVLVRIGLIGSVSYETAAASISAGTAGAELGGPTYTPEVFAIAFFAMSLGGAMWMLATLVLTPLLQRGENRLAKVNPALMTVVPAAALLGAFISLGLAEVPKSMVHVLTLVTSAAVMGVCLLIARLPGMRWLREWGLGIAILLGLTVAFLAQSAGLGPAA
ncbi:DUF5058 family protein [Citricoccus sp. SGAir0253]|uniref:DUF5058 family protein n=1 Tax=Citricoccus sp. SGAir0253 TaxID=2567881 RepID=UPI0010CD4C6B|nr:DUF5058 family protein [Citricoccus sp. SGAir0253]QCU77212.1 DUF5058 family protein [Citricoccus sp. SGAir0253]